MKPILTIMFLALVMSSAQGFDNPYTGQNDLSLGDESLNSNEQYTAFSSELDEENSSFGRRLLIALRLMAKPAPPPKPPAPKAAPPPPKPPAPKAAPPPPKPPAPKAAPPPPKPPAPKAAPPPPKPPAPAPAPKATPKAAPAPAPTPKATPKATPAPTPKAAPAPKATPAPTPKATPKATPAPAPAPKATPAPTQKAVISPVFVPISIKSANKGELIDFPIKMTCDNNFRLYVNGKFVGSGDNWQKVYSFTPQVKLGVDTIAIEGHDVGGPAAFIGVFNKVSSKPSDWVCKEFKASSPTSNWNLNNFDDSAWKSPVSYGKNSDKNTVWFNVNRGSLSDLSSDAQWFWTGDYNNHDHVYCRMNQATLKERLTPTLSTESKPKISDPKPVVKQTVAIDPKITLSNTRTTLSKLSAADKKLAQKIDDQFNNWLVSKDGVSAVEFCKSLGIQNRPDIYQGCLEDIMRTGNKEIAKEGAIAEEEFRSKSKISLSKKYCTASGDPHFVNYDGDIYHLQEKGIYTLMKTTHFEVQEKVRKNGADKTGVPCCLTALAVRYKSVTVEVDAENFKKITINGVSQDLPADYTIKVGGLELKYGKQKFEWKGEGYTTTGLKIIAPNGFGVMVSGGYCGVVEINVPMDYFNKVQGLCGNADGSRDNNDYKNPEGAVMNVNRGARNWEMSGYHGPNSPLSKWELSWKPLGAKCFFIAGCESEPIVVKATVSAPSSPKATVSAPTPAKATVSAPSSPKATVSAPTPAKVVVSAPTPAKAAVSAPSSPKATVSAPAKATVSAPSSPKATVSAPTPAKATVSAPSSPKATVSAPTPAKVVVSAPTPTPTPAKGTVSAPTPTPTPTPAKGTVSAPTKATVSTPAKATIYAPTPTPAKETKTPHTNKSPVVHLLNRTKHYIQDNRSHCISDGLAVRYDGRGGVFIAGTNHNQKVHVNKLECDITPQGWVKIAQFNATDVKKVTVSTKGLIKGKSRCGGVKVWNADKVGTAFYKNCNYKNKGVVIPTVKTDVSISFHASGSQSSTPKPKTPTQSSSSESSKSSSSSSKVESSTPKPQSPSTTSGTKQEAPSTTSSPKPQSPSTTSGPKQEAPPTTSGPKPQTPTQSSSSGSSKSSSSSSKVESSTPSTVSTPKPQSPSTTSGPKPQSPTQSSSSGSSKSSSSSSKVESSTPKPQSPPTTSGPKQEAPSTTSGPKPQSPTQSSSSGSSKSSSSTSKVESSTPKPQNPPYKHVTMMREMDQFLGQWYLMATTYRYQYNRADVYHWRTCTIATIFGHGDKMYLKEAHNLGNQTYTFHDFRVDEFNKPIKQFVMNKKTYSYELVQFHNKKDVILGIYMYNMNDNTEKYVFTEKVVKDEQVQLTIKSNFRDLEIITLDCYTD